MEPERHSLKIAGRGHEQGSSVAFGDDTITRLDLQFRGLRDPDVLIVKPSGNGMRSIPSFHRCRAGGPSCHAGGDPDAIRLRCAPGYEPIKDHQSSRRAVSLV